MISIVTRRGLLGVALAGLAVPAALAQPGPGPGGGPGMMGGGRMGGGMMGGGWDPASYLERLKERLAITAAQEPAWAAYADVVNGTAETMRALHQSVYESMGTATWEERRNMMNTMFDARHEAQKNVVEAADKLLGQLDPAQQRQAQQVLPGLGYGPRGGRGPGAGMGPGNGSGPMRRR